MDEAEEVEEEEMKSLSLCRGQVQERPDLKKPVRGELLPTVLCRPTRPDVCWCVCGGRGGEGALTHAREERQEKRG